MSRSRSLRWLRKQRIEVYIYYEEGKVLCTYDGLLIVPPTSDQITLTHAKEQTARRRGRSSRRSLLLFP